MGSTGSKLLRQSLALLLAGSYLSCSTFTSFEALQGPDINQLPPNTRKLRILPVEFKNSANMQKLNFVSDGQHQVLLKSAERSKSNSGGSPFSWFTESAEGDDQFASAENRKAAEGQEEPYEDISIEGIIHKGIRIRKELPSRESDARNQDTKQSEKTAPGDESQPGQQSTKTVESERSEEVQVKQDSGSAETLLVGGYLIPRGDGASKETGVAMIDGENVPTMDGGAILKEVLISNMVQSNRFDILTDAAFKTTGDAGLPQKSELREKQVDYLLFAEITDFEVKQNVEYWKVPLWALLLIAALLVQDDDTRAFLLHTLLRLVIYLPSDSKFWEMGLGTEDLELRVSASVNLRLVDPYSGSVVYADQASLDRVETVGNMDLILWRTENSLQIKESTAGRQLRFLTANMVNDLVRRMTPASALEAAPTEQ
ncbi:MAG: hypothetical protein CMN76_03240 [Spirochaetaceae bacterium]|nr:hypothetical protein [Spirochaetaceae bacterium]|tara:strand:- start:91750 stop:93036 length:1287 start_codon:yes stop_codon:yes gene_type:complete